MIMWGDVAEGAAAPTDCGAQGTSVDVPQTARPSGGAGDSAPTNTLSLSEC